MNITFDKKIPMRGDITIRVLDGVTGKELKKIEIRNKITFLAADDLVELIAQRATDAAPANNKIHSMRMGTANTAASRSDTNLGVPILGFILADINKVTSLPGQIQFTATMDTATGNGNTFRECGLFTKGSGTGAMDAPGLTGTSPRLFARQTHPDLVKTSAISLQYSWTISFTA